MNNQQNSDTRTLIEWTSSIYAIFWSIWLGLYVDKLSTFAPINLIPTNWISPIAIGFFLIVLLYTYHLVKWLWLMGTVNPDSPVKVAIKLQGKAFFLVILIMAAIHGLGTIYKVPFIWTGLGYLSTIGWPVSIITIVCSDRRRW